MHPYRRMPAFALAAIAVPALALGGGGSGAAAKPPTAAAKQAFIRRADAICASHRHEFSRPPMNPEQATKRDLPALARWTAHTSIVFHEGRRDLQRLGTPPADARLWQRSLVAIDSSLVELSKAISAALDGNAKAFRRAFAATDSFGGHELQAQFGLKVCSTG